MPSKTDLDLANHHEQNALRSNHIISFSDDILRYVSLDLEEYNEQHALKSIKIESYLFWMVI